MEKLKIEKNIPVYEPKCGGREASEHPFPFADMLPGDSFLYGCNNDRDCYGYNYSYSYLKTKMAQYKKKIKNSKLEFAVRTVLGGYRCWRVS